MMHDKCLLEEVHIIHARNIGNTALYFHMAIGWYPDGVHLHPRTNILYFWSESASYQYKWVFCMCFNEYNDGIVRIIVWGAPVIVTCWAPEK